MKKILAMVFVSLFLLAMIQSPAGAEEEKIPNLTGHWHGKAMMHKKTDGFAQGEETAKFVIEKQEGRVFHGKKIWVSNKTEMTENFSGVVAINNDRIYMADHNEGFTFGDIVSKDKLVIYYMHDGENTTVIIMELNRVKP